MTFTKTAVASLIALSATGVQAAAFQLAEVSTSGLGFAYAGNAAVADNASAVATNPALMTTFKRAEISAGGVYVAPNVNITEGKINTVKKGRLVGDVEPAQEDALHKNIVPKAFIPNIYAVVPVNERFAIGAGINVNYGMKTEFDANYSAGPFGGRTSLAATNINLSSAYKLGGGFSLGVGLNAVHADAMIERYLGAGAEALKVQTTKLKRALELAILPTERVIAAAEKNGDTTTAEQQKELLTYHKQNFFNNAVLSPERDSAGNIVLTSTGELSYVVDPEKTAKLRRLGINNFDDMDISIEQMKKVVQAVETLQYNTVIHKLEGAKWGFGWNVGLAYEFNPNNRLGVAYHSAVDLRFKGKYSNTMPFPVQGVVEKVTGGASISGSLTLVLPAYWEISGYHKLTDKLAAQYSYKRTDWSSFKSLDGYSQNGNRLFHKTENFNDSSRIAIGFSYDLIPSLTLRTGVAYDESASVSNPSISIPDTDRTWYSAGATIRFTPNLSTDIGYSHLRGRKSTFNEEGRAVFTSKATGNLYGLNVNYKF